MHQKIPLKMYKEISQKFLPGKSPRVSPWFFKGVFPRFLDFFYETLPGSAFKKVSIYSFKNFVENFFKNSFKKLLQDLYKWFPVVPSEFLQRVPSKSSCETVV